MSTLNPIFQNQKAQKVEVVNALSAKIENSSGNPIPVALSPNFIAGSGSSSAIRVQVASTNTWVMCRPSGTNLNLHFSSVHVVNSGVGTIFPIDMWVYVLTSSALENNVSSVYSCYSLRFPSATSITVFYETVNAAGTVAAHSYSSGD